MATKDDTLSSDLQRRIHHIGEILSDALDDAQRNDAPVVAQALLVWEQDDESAERTTVTHVDFTHARGETFEAQFADSGGLTVMAMAAGPSGYSGALWVQRKDEVGNLWDFRATATPDLVQVAVVCKEPPHNPRLLIIYDDGATLPEIDPRDTPEPDALLDADCFFDVNQSWLDDLSRRGGRIELTVTLPEAP